uniref:Enoyl-CoA hydratase/isomerase family protein n=1 Tax=Panagrellus redivivus TaxID=6233 RepID=A0A7E4VDJ1_PANRE
MLTMRSVIRGLATDWRQSYSPEAAKSFLQKFAGGQVRLEKDEGKGVAKIVLDHQEKKNAFSGKMMVDLEAAVTDLESWGTGRLVIVEGAGSDFCTGGDLSFMKAIANSNDAYMMNKFMGSTLRRLRQLPLVSIANGYGFALGGGSEVYTTCDIRAAKTGFKVGYVQGRLGVSPGWGGTAKIADTVGRARAIEFLATAKVLDIKTAVDAGLINFVYDDPKEFDAYIQKFTKNSVQAVRGAKLCISNSVDAGVNHEAQEAADREVFTSLWGSKGHLDAVAQNLKHK